MIVLVLFLGDIASGSNGTTFRSSPETPKPKPLAMMHATASLAFWFVC